MSPHEAVSEFTAAMAETGMQSTEPIIPDGGLHRVHLEGDRRGTRNGWYVLHPDPPVSGAFGCWKRGISGTWSAVEQARLSRAARASSARRLSSSRSSRLVETARQHEEVAGRAAWIWRQCGPAPADHPYLIAKQVSPGNARIGRENRLVLPVVDLSRKLWSLQFIGADGGKRFLRGGRIRGCMIPVAGEMPGASRILLCEGWATGMTLAAMEPDALVLAALNAGNLEPVAVAVRRQWPDTEIVVCCDADPVGIGKGRAAAIAADAQVAIPEFPAGVQGSDFNDLAAAMRRKEAA